MSLGEALWWLLFVSWMSSSAYFDLCLRRVPNVLVVTAVFVQLLFLAYSAWAHQPMPGARNGLTALGGFLLGFLFIVFWFRGAMGAGDVKFLAALGFWVGWGPLVAILALGSLLAGLHAILHLFSPIGNYVLLKLKQDRGIPYAGYLAIGAVSLALMQWNSDSCSWFSLPFCTPY